MKSNEPYFHVDWAIKAGSVRLEKFFVKSNYFCIQNCTFKCFDHTTSVENTKNKSIEYFWIKKKNYFTLLGIIKVWTFSKMQPMVEKSLPKLKKVGIIISLPLENPGFVEKQKIRAHWNCIMRMMKLWAIWHYIT